MKMSDYLPFFSIVIPTLNEERYIPKILKCLEKQTFRDFEVIVCDGASNDKTIAVTKKFENRLPKLTILQNNRRNVAYQRNSGAKIAKGVYLQFMDADVSVKKDYLEKLYGNLVNKDIPVATTWLLPDSKHPIDEAMILLTNLVIETSRFIDFPLAPGFNIIFKREVFFEVGGFPEDLKLAEDHEIVRRANRKGYQMAVFKQPQMTASLRRLRKEGRLTVARKYTKATLYILLKGPITKDMFDYPMGGHYYAIKKNKKTILNFLQTLSENQRKKAVKTIKDILELP